MNDDKKIIIDEDWKTQVAAERETLEAESSAPQAKPEESASPSPQAIPPASMEMLLTTLATEAMVAMGQFPNPADNEVSTHIDHARYVIDLLEMLQEKTKGNLSPGEEAMLTDLLHQLRMLFVSVQAGLTQS